MPEKNSFSIWLNQVDSRHETYSKRKKNRRKEENGIKKGNLRDSQEGREIEEERPKKKLMDVIRGGNGEEYGLNGEMVTDR